MTLDDTQVLDGLAAGWRHDGDTLRLELTFRDFDLAMRFVEDVARHAVDYERRPDMCISQYNHVLVTVANPHHAGITVAERRLAEKVDAVVARHPEAGSPP